MRGDNEVCFFFIADSVFLTARPRDERGSCFARRLFLLIARPSAVLALNIT